MTEPQPSSELDLDEGERLLAAYNKKRRGGRLSGVNFSRGAPEGDIDAYMWWLFDNGEALVTALRDFQALHCTCKFNAEWPEQPDDLAVQWAFEECPYHEQMRTALRAAQQQSTHQGELLHKAYEQNAEWEQRYEECLQASERLGADLTRVETNKELLSEENALLTLRVQRVEAERDQLVIHSIPLSTAAQSIDKFRKENERLQARIAELTHLIGDADTGLAERLSSALDRIAELEGR